MKKTFFISLLLSSVVCFSQQRDMGKPGFQDSLLHKDHRPKSLFTVSNQTSIQKAKYPAIDMHHHSPMPGEGNFDSIAIAQIKNMDAAGIQKTILFCGTGDEFDGLAKVYSKYPDRFMLFCGLDLSGFHNSASAASTIAELERCVKLGARGIGEFGDKGSGLNHDTVLRMHIDDSRMEPVLEKLAELKMPLVIHVGDPKWMYEPMDVHNDLLFESYYYRLDTKKNILDLSEMVATLENAVKKHPRTTFVACHLLNQTFDLNNLGKLFDKYPNLYADVSQREAYVAAIPKFAKQFVEKYADRLVYGTDQGHSLSMYRNTFHIWETNDEHFYAWDVSNTPWALSGLGLNDATLKKLYRDNALRILKK